METIKQKGLSGTALKMLALGLMVLDHIHYFFGFTGLVPDWFSMLGRLAAPLFLFTVVEGFSHTRNRKRYFLRVLAVSAGMGALEFFMMYDGFLVRPDGFFPLNAIMMNFVVLMVVWQGMDWLCQKRFVRGALAVALPLVWPFAVGALTLQVPKLAPALGFLSLTATPAWSMITDGGYSYILLGLLLYALRNHRKAQAAAFVAFEMLYDFLYIALTASSLPGFHWGQMFTVYYEWMSVFAVLPMLCYNGRRGKGFKTLFYVFYPAHVYILYALSWEVYLWMAR